MSTNNIACDHLCGVLYTALPIATLLSQKRVCPMLIRRNETKTYGTKKLIEGKYKPGDTALIIEDVVTSGSSVLATVADLKKEGLAVNDAIVVVNREQGGRDSILAAGIRFHSLFTLSQLLDILKDVGRIDAAIVDKVRKYIADSQIKPIPVHQPINRMKLSYAERIEHTNCEAAKNLFRIMATKETNLCIAADLTSSAEILNLAEQIGPYICVLKTHVDIIDDFTDKFIVSLTAIAKKHNFVIMEDRKFADIGNTVAYQYHNGIYKIAQWADLVTVHSLPGAGILHGLKSILTNESESRGVFLLAEMSCADNLITTKYVDDTIAMAEQNRTFVAGIVGQNCVAANVPGLIQLTPGVKIDDTMDELGQQYNTPEYVIKEKGADIGVVGRGIIQSKNIEITAKLYRDQLWTAYCERIIKN